MLRKILAVDDSALIHQMYKLFLSRYKNCKLVSAMNGLEALDKLGQEENVDLILLDINMPTMEWLELLERLKADAAFASIPVIIVSTEGKDEDTIRGLKMGAKAYVKKPFEASELHGLIEKITVGLQAPSSRTVPGCCELLDDPLEERRASHLEALDHCLLTLEREGAGLRSGDGRAGPAPHAQGQQRDDRLRRDQGVRRPPRGCARRGSRGRAAAAAAAFDQLFVGASALRDAVERACVHASPRCSRTSATRPGGTCAAAARRGRGRPPGAPAPARPRPPRHTRASDVDTRHVATRSEARARVDFSELDHLLNLVGEPIIVPAPSSTRAGPRHVVERGPRRGATCSLPSTKWAACVDAAPGDGTWTSRDAAVRHVFERFPRLVRDLAHEQGKEHRARARGRGRRGVGQGRDRRARGAARRT